jgi:hypothetical protein
LHLRWFTLLEIWLEIIISSYYLSLYWHPFFCVY